MSFFTDIIQKDRRFHSTLPVLDILLLEPTFRAAILALLRDALVERVTLRLLETYRSVERQEQLFEAGATQLRHVGVHHYGLACDLGIMIGGQVNWKADYSILGRLAKKHGLVWGGTWNEPDKPHSFRDYDHIQRIMVEHQSQLFAGTWYPDGTYNADDPKTWPLKSFT